MSLVYLPIRIHKGTVFSFVLLHASADGGEAGKQKLGTGAFLARGIGATDDEESAALAHHGPQASHVQRVTALGKKEKTLVESIDEV